jgi:hypothetical protein
MGFWRKIQEKRDHYENLNVVGRMLLKWIFERMEWFGLD